MKGVETAPILDRLQLAVCKAGPALSSCRVSDGIANSPDVSVLFLVFILLLFDGSAY